MSSLREPSYRLRYDQLTKPAQEPVSISDVRTHRRLDSDDTGQDSLVALLIPTARQYAEDFTGESFITRSWRATADAFPGAYAVPRGYVGEFARGMAVLDRASPIIELSHGPVTGITSVTYVDTTGVSQTLDPALYVVDLSGGGCRIAPAYGTAWPVTRPQLGAVRIDYEAGYGTDPEDVPERYRHWMLVRIGTIFENREETAVIARGRLEAVPVLDGLLQFDREVVI